MSAQSSEPENTPAQAADGANNGNTDSGESAANGRAPFYKTPLRVAVLGLVVLAVLIAGGWYWYYAQQFVSTEDAFVKGRPIQIAPQVAGPVAQVLVEENELVDQGQVLARIAPADYDVALSRAEAQREAAAARLAQAAAQLDTLKAQVETSQAQLRVAQTRVRNARADLTRLRGIDPQYVEDRELDDAADRLDESKAQRRAAAKRVAAKRAEVTSGEARIDDARAELKAARAEVRQATLNRSYTILKAPEAGQVATVGVEAGEYATPGQALMAIVPEDVWVKANFKETQITHMRPGQPVKIHIDAYPERDFDGHVVAIQRATGSQFGLLPPQNATGNFVKVVQRVPVRIAFDEPPKVHTLAPGLSVVPTVRVLEHPPWPWAQARAHAAKPGGE